MHRPEIAGDTLTALLMLLLAELLGAPTVWLHVCALVLVVARFVHIRALVHQLGKWSGPSMPALGATWVIILLLALGNAFLVLVSLAAGDSSLTSF